VGVLANTYLVLRVQVQQHGIQLSMDGKAPGAITSLSSGCGRASSMRKCTCTLTTRYPKPARGYSGTSRFITSVDRIHRLAAGPRIWSISPRCHRLRQPDMNPAELHLKNKSFCPASRSHCCRLRHPAPG
jgi:hypothetical protein